MSVENLLYSYNNKYWMPGYSHQSWNGRLDFEHKTRREGERLTLSYMLALTRQSLKASVKKAEHSIENDDVVGGITKGN